ncbi:coiled-coil domain-containing protein 42-like [Phymastichus coffea]|uniref:coiled-coil domain-containing protein 42-like n=1 Tax=Phymastichus coffea TaxID=108790 RepID=UPI00273B3073|nr:coiled-coil domain-containing protein 42-like [Phymastichus coffea]
MTTSFDMHYPEWDVLHGDPAIELMRVRRELASADADLEAKRLEYNARRQEADELWNDLREKQRQLRQSFIMFDDFVKENREKRERAERKIRDEKDRQKIRLAEIEELEKNLDYMEKARDKMKGFVEEYKPFQKYLESVLETNEFQSIAEIFNRYDTLIAARAALVENQDESLQTLERTSAHMQRMTEDKSQSLMDLNGRQAQLQSRHERARAKALHWENVVARVKEVTAQQELEETQVRACIWNLYRQICKRKGVPTEASRDDLEQQLLHVKRTIVELGKIVRAAKHKASREAKDLAATARQKDNLQAQARLLEKQDTKSSFRSSVDTLTTVRSVWRH